MKKWRYLKIVLHGRRKLLLRISRRIQIEYLLWPIRHFKNTYSEEYISFLEGLIKSNDYQRFVEERKESILGLIK